MSRNPARKGPADGNHRAIRDAIEAIGCPVMDLSAAGNGVEDLLVGLSRWHGYAEADGVCPGYRRWWVVVECKVARNKRGDATASQFTLTQQKWRDATRRHPRITATSAQDAVDQIRRMQG